ncbi:hypothetical protein CCR85_01245 [Rhodothalassium salexigens]|nr:hypothetical protein [Rhodothalassium salexigens]MBK5920731.1 hypothetical protein [Rhodothalassium salexigens]
MTGTPAARVTQYPAGRARLDEALARVRRESLKPPPKLSLSQWARQHFKLSAETSAETGRFRPWGFQVGLLDAVTDPTVERITIKKSARVGYTKLIDAAVGYFIHQDPSPMVVVQPRVEDAEDYAKTEIAPMLRDCPALARIVGPVKGKDPNFTIRKKQFRNGATLSLLGASSPNEFRRLSVRVVAFDEVDAYPVDQDEGDQIQLGEKRTQGFWNRKIILGSTPTTKGQSRIDASWADSDQRVYEVACPHCGAWQRLEWGADKPYGLRWDKAEDGTPRPETAHYVCRAAGCVIEEAHKADMVAGGRWVATRPSRGHAGFHISALYSLFYNARWAVLVREFLEARDDPARLQVFVNTVLGETWETPADQEVDHSALAARRRADYRAGEVPAAVGLLTAGVDTQDDRLEVEVTGWGYDEERWSIWHEVIVGDTASAEPWERLDALLLHRWVRQDGASLVIQAAAVDTQGHRTQQAYGFCTARARRNVWGIRGAGQRNGRRGPVWPRKPSTRNKGGHPVYNIDPNTAKDELFPRFGLETGPGACHFPADYDTEFFRQLTAERPVTERVRGQSVRRWRPRGGVRNEAWDCWVYAYAALCGLRQGGWSVNRVCAEQRAAVPAASAAAAGQAPPAGQAATGAGANSVKAPVLPVSSSPAPPPVPAGSSPKAGGRRTRGPRVVGRMRR